mgnify:CR=1 FL=1
MLIQRRASNPDLNFVDSVHPLLQQVYRKRSIQSSNELELGTGPGVAAAAAANRVVIPSPIKTTDAVIFWILLLNNAFIFAS